VRDKPGVFHAVVLCVLRWHPASNEWKEVRAVKPEKISGARLRIRWMLQ
jgi:hypothetical protein